MAEDLQSKAAEMMKKVLTIGVGTIFLTEESLRGLVGELKLPKELMSGIMKSAGETKNEFLQKLTKEVMDRVGTKINPSELLAEFLSKNEIEFNVRMSVKPKKQSGHTHRDEHDKSLDR